MKEKNFGIGKEVFEMLNDFPNQIEKSLKIAEKIEIEKFKINNIVISGMGGSGISGDIVREFLLNKCSIPIFVSKEYSLPKFANENTLVFVVSYSGNTEETVSSLKDAIAKKCKIIAIASNGEIEEICKLNKINFIKIQNGLQPRFALPSLLFPILLVIEKIGLTKVKKEIEKCLEILKEEREEIQKQAKKIAKNLRNKIPLIYSYFPYNCVGKRWKNQFNENAKVFSFVNEFPECCHNDIQSWEDKFAKNFAVIILRDEDEEKRMKKRINTTKKLALKNSYKIIEIYAKGINDLSKIIYLVYFGDYVSVYLSELYKRNPLKIEIIEKLKKELKK